jgi:hypothetical protein
LWFAYVQNDQCYYDASSAIFNITIVGDLYPNVTWPNGTAEYEHSIFPSMNSLNITGDVLSDCLNKYLNNSDVNFTIVNNASQNKYYCNSTIGIGNLGNGSYNCTWNYNGADFGWYDIIMNASNVSFFNNFSRTRYHAFRIINYTYSPAVLKNETLIFEDDGGWGENFTFRVNVTDVDAEDINVTLWLSPDNVSWVEAETKICYQCLVEKEVDFHYQNFTCENITNETAGEYRYFKFNATDAHNETDRASFNFTIVADDVDIVYGGSGNATNVNRTATLLLKLLVHDWDRHTDVPPGANGTIWITYNNSNFNAGTSNETDSLGYLSYYFIPNCSYSVGSHFWYGGTTSNFCYKDNESENLTFTVFGWLNNTLLAPNGTDYENVYYSNNNVTISIAVKDEVDGADCENNVTDANVTITVSHNDPRFVPSQFNQSCSPVYNWSTGIYNCTWNISGSPSGWYNVTITSNRTLYNPDVELKRSFFHQVAPVLYGEYTGNSSVPWGDTASKSTITFYANVTDDDDNVTVRVWESKGSPTGPWTEISSSPKYCYDCINSTMNFTRLYQFCSDVDIWYWMINATDKYGMNASTAVYMFNVTKRNVTFQLVQGNDSYVNRTYTNTTYLRMKMTDNYDGGIPSLSVNPDFYATHDGNNFNWIGDDDLNPSGEYWFTFDPSCSYQVMAQKWKSVLAGDSCYNDNESVNYTFTITSILNNTILPSQKYLIKGEENAVLLGNVYDLQGSSCENVSGATVTFQVNSSSCSAVNDMQNGSYNCTWSTAFAFIGGWYDVMMNSSKPPYWYGDSKLSLQQFRVVSRPQLVNVTADSEKDGWGHEFHFTVRFRDNEEDNVDNITLWKAYNQTGPFYPVTNQTVESTDWTTVDFHVNFSCSDMLQENGIVYYKFNTTNRWNKTNETSVFNITLLKDNLSLTVESGTGGFVNRISNN